MEKYQTYEQLTPFEKCVIRNHTIYYAPMISMAAKDGNGRLSPETLDAAMLRMRDITLAVGGIENVIATINTPGHPEAPILPRCAQQYTPSRSTPANAR
ncbi:MAG: hypothetical protein V4735_05765 [Pseudomonadota bacterium]